MMKKKKRNPTCKADSSLFWHGSGQESWALSIGVSPEHLQLTESLQHIRQCWKRGSALKLRACQQVLATHQTRGDASSAAHD